SAEPDLGAAFATVEQARAALKAVLASLDARNGSKSGAVRLIAPALDALRRERDQVAQELLDEEAHLGPTHARVAELRQRLAAFDKALEAQRAIERIWVSAFLADLEKPSPERKENRLLRAGLMALAIALKEATDCAQPSAAPYEIEVLSQECRAARFA